MDISKYGERSQSPGYWSYDGLEIQAGVETHQFVVDFAQRHLAPGARILDVGAGSGALCKQLLDAGFNVSCTSWDGRIQLPVEVYALDLDHAFDGRAVGGRPFDLVCCIEVIEHVENPAALLRSCRAVVDPQGKVLVSTPNVESIGARLQWLLRGYPRIFSETEVHRNRHISMMFRQGLEHQIRCAGFDIAEKHLMGEPYLRSAAQRLVKGVLFSGLRRILPGETYGETRLYVLAPTDAASVHGPGKVY